MINKNDTIGIIALAGACEKEKIEQLKKQEQSYDATISECNEIMAMIKMSYSEAIIAVTTSQNYEELINQIDISKIKIRHISASEALANYEKAEFINGCRLRNNNVRLYKL